MGLSNEKETTTCFKCPAEIVAYVGQVHPLCDECQEDFDYWFEKEIRMFQNAQILCKDEN